MVQYSLFTPLNFNVNLLKNFSMKLQILGLITILAFSTALNAQSLTGPQKNAVESARQYLSLKGFSRDGLIHQLSSRAGDGYDISDATVAVNSLKVDWNNQAVIAAKEYLDLMAFSCQGLIKQLSSRAGDQFTAEQATYGARKSGAC